MALFKLFRKRNGNTGNLGSVVRSIGYLQGGYKDSTIHSKVQLFNTVTQVGSIVYDTGFQRRYRPGVSGNLNGYFSTSDTQQHSKFNYIAASASASFKLTNFPACSSLELYTYTQAWILCNTAAPVPTDSVEEWVRLDLTTETPSSKGSLNTAPYGTTRQALSTGAGAFFSKPSNGYMYGLNYATQVITAQGAYAQVASAMQIPCGMSVNNSKGYLVGMTPYNGRFTYTGGVSISAVASATSYSYNFGESHSLVGSDSGFMMAGYSDTTGRYGNTQHGLCQKMNLATEAIATLPDLVLPQSSGQMMQGF